jgi:WD40 repeat protein
MNTPWAGRFLWALAVVQMGTVAGQEQARVRLQIQAGRELVGFVAFSPDGRSVVTGGLDGLPRLWDVATGREILRFAGHSEHGEVTSVAFSPDGRSVVTGSFWTARLWDVASGREIRRFEGHSRAVTSVAFSPDGRSILTGDYTARLWDIASGREIRRFEGMQNPELRHRFEPDPQQVMFSPDGRLILTGGDYVQLWDAASGREIRRVDSVSFGGAAFSPDGRSFAAGSDDNTTRLWDCRLGSRNSPLRRKFIFQFGGVFPRRPVYFGWHYTAARMADTARPASELGWKSEWAAIIK